jgi:cytochrome c peroxidase
MQEVVHGLFLKLAGLTVAGCIALCGASAFAASDGLLDEAALLERAGQIVGPEKYDNNCSTCHTGTMFGGQMLQKVGVTRPWPNQKDLGHFQVSKDPSHKMVFRVSTLRNVAKTAPYFHDASSRRLWDAIRKMGQHEIGRQFSVEDILSMQEFLKSLTGKPDEAYIKPPVLPK